MSDWSRETYFDTEKIHIPEDREHPRFSFRKLWAFTGEEKTEICKFMLEWSKRFFP
jgi:hypothetical protein